MDKSLFILNMITISFEWQRYNTDAAADADAVADADADTDADADADSYRLYCQGRRGLSLMFTLSSVLNATIKHYPLVDSSCPANSDFPLAPA